MLRMLYADTRAMLLSKGLRLCMGACIAYQWGYAFLMWLLLKYVLPGEGLYAEEILAVYPGIASFAVTAATLLIFTQEYSDGIITNKLCSGAKRREIFFSLMINALQLSAVMSAAAQLSGLLAAVLFGEGFYNLTLAEMADSFLELLIASAAVAVFSSALIMILGGKSVSYIVGLGIAFLCKLAGFEVMDKLYPTSGRCMLSGTKLSLYTFYDKYIPYSHFGGTPRWDMAAALAGCLGCILISLAAGLILFRKKEIR
ncbi:MAG: hypothetical protein IK115_10565 [Lachnospiraceae bacterium]|nr:hypothetical protein [Lachnospiraceae bacterium]